MTSLLRRMSIGAEILPNRGVNFRVWAPILQEMEVILIDPSTNSHYSYSLTKDEKGYFSTTVLQAKVGSLYYFKITGEEFLFPDPASRYQPNGPHGPSKVIDNTKFQWTDHHWKGIAFEDRVLYEMHIGTFTQQGTFQSAKRELLELADLGITIIELMPINEFPGTFGWGYDGVNLFAPFHHYGTPEDLCDFIDHAHCLGIAVILDVVYNHIGPDGNYFRVFAPHFFTDDYKTDWGDAINFHGEESEEVRLFFKTNASYWIKEFHFDGLRLDATQNIYDTSHPHIITEIAREVLKAAPGRQTYIVAENEDQEVLHVIPAEHGGYGLDAVWNDDFHHIALVRLTGRREAYYMDYTGTPQEFISAIKYGYLYQGQWYLWHKRNRGTSSFHLDPGAFVNFIQNHDQIANSAHGLRLHYLADPGNYRAITALMLLAPGTPLLFQGEEFAASTPFHYFADHHEDLARLVFSGRKDSFKHFPSISTPEIQACMPPPESKETFLKCKLDFADRERHVHAYHLHRDLLKLRRNDCIFTFPRLGGIDGAVLNSDAFVLHYFGDNHEDSRLILINFGADFKLSPSPEPLLAAPNGTSWKILWSSEDCRYGGGGTPPLFTNQDWIVQGHSALVLISEKMKSLP